MILYKIKLACIGLYSITFSLMLAATTFNKHDIAITKLLNNYTSQRGVTILEIGIDKCNYVFDLSHKYNSTCVMMYLGALHTPNQFEVEQKYPHMVIVNPVTLTVKDLETLVRCEHFDVVIVHGIPSKLKKGHELRQEFKVTLDLIMQLGDHTYIELNKYDKDIKDHLLKKNAKLVSKNNSNLYYLETPKKGLDIARWNCNWMNWQKPLYRYPILSTFDKKHYQKKETEDQHIPWLKGINLSTFVMLRGICPCEATIQKNLNNMRSIKHNDLIIGNMIVQGKDIIPIDLDDPRWNGNVYKCITAALTVFNNASTRLKNPDEALRFYRSYLDKMNKGRSD